MTTPTPAPLIIEAGRADRHYWRDLWRYRELLGFLAWRDIKVRYKQAVLGCAWALIQPAVQTVLLTFVFGVLAKMPKGGVGHYSLLVLAGLLPWQLFSSAFSGAGSSLLSNSHLISKIYFPRLVTPLAALGVALVDFAVMLVITLPVLFVWGAVPTWRLLVLPCFILAALLIALGAGLWISALTVKYRDFRYIAPFLLQVGLFVTPVGYRTDLLPHWRGLLALNPLTGVVGGFRWSLLGGGTDLNGTEVATSLAIAAILVGTGLWYFRATERQFADVI